MPGIVLSGPAKPVIDLNGRPVIYFGGTNYLGMSYNENVILAAQEGLIKWGISSAGSRETTGGASVHDLLEEKICEFLQRESAVTCCSGYMVNLVLLQALRNEYDACLVDDGAHCSVKDAVAGSRMRSETFACGDAAELESKLRDLRSKKEKALICSDGVLASGELAPVDEYQALAHKYETAVIMDDAHGIGVLGEHGRGTLEYLGLDGHRVYQTGTLSKAYGCFGGFAAGDGPLTELVRINSAAYVGATPLPPAIAAAAIVSLETANGGRRTETTRAKRALRETSLS
jgi:7-keto-8-aminopelargonate synthetase-like enzyme